MRTPGHCAGFCAASTTTRVHCALSETRVLLLSAYAAGSHRHWSEQLQAMLPGIRFTELRLPPRHFNWRVRGNALSWAFDARATLTENWDAVLATSTVDLATLRGLVPALAQRPNLLYFHENQFAYPRSGRQVGEVEVQMTSIYAALAADRLLFNSRFNLQTFLSGVDQLLARLPDGVPAGVVERLAARAEVLPVPVPVPRSGGGRSAFSGNGPGCRLAWLGRFEYDKGLQGLAHCLDHLVARQVDFEIALLGQRFRRQPPGLEALLARHAERIVYAGQLPAVDYAATLADADVALSTALHEFQGIAMMEAVHLGCIPCVPDRQVYPEIYPDHCRYTGDVQDARADGVAAAERLLALVQSTARPPDLEAFLPSALEPRYAALFA